MEQETVDRRALEFTHAFLAQFGVSLRGVMREVDVGDGEALAVVGSVADGLANRFSDLDLLLIGPRRQSGAVIFRKDGMDSVVFRLNHDLEVNIDYVDVSELETLESDFAAAFGLEHDEAPTVRQLTDTQVTLLHRIRTGGAVLGDLKPWRARLNVQKLPDYLISTNLINHYIHREDAIGELAAGDDESAAFIMAYSMGFLATLLLAHIGETNSKPWWTWKLLRRARETAGAALVDPLLRYMTPQGGGDAQTFVAEASRFADILIEDCVAARPHLIPIIDSITDRVRFVKAP
jgi:hypothetical protein